MQEEEEEAETTTQEEEGEGVEDELAEASGTVQDIFVDEEYLDDDLNFSDIL